LALKVVLIKQIRFLEDSFPALRPLKSICFWAPVKGHLRKAPSIPLYLRGKQKFSPFVKGS